MNSLYMIGSLRNREGVIAVAKKIRLEHNIEAFDDWLSPGEEADDKWKEYEQARGRTYQAALGGWAAKHVFDFDKSHLDRCDGGVLVLPAGKSCHLEAGYISRTKPLFVLVDEPDRWDVMYQFAKYICFTERELLDAIGDEIAWREEHGLIRGPQHGLSPRVWRKLYGGSELKKLDDEEDKGDSN